MQDMGHLVTVAGSRHWDSWHLRLLAMSPAVTTMVKASMLYTPLSRMESSCSGCTHKASIQDTPRDQDHWEKKTIQSTVGKRRSKGQVRTGQTMNICIYISVSINTVGKRRIWTCVFTSVFPLKWVRLQVKRVPWELSFTGRKCKGSREQYS